MEITTVDLHFSKALFSLNPDNLQLKFLRLGALFCWSFVCSLGQPCKTLQTVQVALKIGLIFNTHVYSG